MIKGRHRKFDRSFLRSLCVRGQHPGKQLPLPRNHKLLIVEGIVMAFRNQPRDVLLFQKKFVKPRDLREHLQIGEILRLEVALRPLRKTPCSRNRSKNSR